MAARDPPACGLNRFSLCQSIPFNNARVGRIHHLAVDFIILNSVETYQWINIHDVSLEATRNGIQLSFLPLSISHLAEWRFSARDSDGCIARPKVDKSGVGPSS